MRGTLSPCEILIRSMHFFFCFFKHIKSCAPDYTFLGILRNRVLAIYQILLGWKKWKYFMKPTNYPTTDGQPNARKKIGLRGGILGLLFFPTAIFFFFVGLGLVLYRKQTTRNPLQSNSPQTPLLMLVIHACMLFRAAGGLPR